MRRTPTLWVPQTRSAALRPGVRKLSRERNPRGLQGDRISAPHAVVSCARPYSFLGSRRAVTARAHAAHDPQASWRRMSALRANGRVR
jgi:hypothetical protein